MGASESQHRVQVRLEPRRAIRPAIPSLPSRIRVSEAGRREVAPRLVFPAPPVSLSVGMPASKACSALAKHSSERTLTQGERAGRWRRIPAIESFAGSIRAAPFLVTTWSVRPVCFLALRVCPLTRTDFSLSVVCCTSGGESKCRAFVASGKSD